MIKYIVFSLLIVFPFLSNGVLLLYKKIRRKKKYKGIVVEIPEIVFFIGVIGNYVFTIVNIGQWFWGTLNDDYTLVSLLIVLIVFGGGIILFNYLSIKTLTFKVILKDDVLIYYSLFGKERRMYIHDTECILKKRKKYYYTAEYLTIKDQKHKVRVESIMLNFDRCKQALADRIEEK